MSDTAGTFINNSKPVSLGEDINDWIKHFKGSDGTYNLALLTSLLMDRCAFGPMQDLMSALSHWIEGVSEISSGSNTLAQLLTWVENNFKPSKDGLGSLDDAGLRTKLPDFIKTFRNYFIAGYDKSDNNPLPKLKDVQIKIGDKTYAGDDPAVLHYMQDAAKNFGPFGQAIFATTGDQHISGFQALIIRVLQAKLLDGHVQPNGDICQVLEKTLQPSPSSGDSSITAAWGLFQGVPTATRGDIHYKLPNGIDRHPEPKYGSDSMLDALMNQKLSAEECYNDCGEFFTFFAQINYATKQSSTDKDKPDMSSDLLSPWVDANQGTQQSANSVSTATTQEEQIVSSQLNVDYNTANQIAQSSNGEEETSVHNEKTA